MKIRKLKSTIAKHCFRETARMLKRRNKMERSGKIPNDIIEIWEAIKVLDKRSKQFIGNLWKV